MALQLSFMLFCMVVDQFPSILICWLSFSSKSQADIDGDALVD